MLRRRLMKRCVIALIFILVFFLGQNKIVASGESVKSANFETEQSITIAGIEVRRGTKKSWELDAGETVLGKVGVPITVINGRKKGPTLAITAACHPMELNGILTTIRLAKEVDPERLAGVLLIVHVQNIKGLELKTGHVSPLDGINMGGAFQVQKEEIEERGSVSHQSKSLTFHVAEKIFAAIISCADYLIDLHGGELFESLVPNIEILPLGQNEIDEKTRFLARAFGFDLIWEVPKGSLPQMPSYPERGSAVLEASLMGIPGVLCEVGREGKIEEDLVDLTVQGIKNVMIALDMWPGEKIHHESRVLVGGHVLFAQRAGLFLTRCKAGDRLSKDQILGYLMNLSGEIVETFYAPSDGILLNMVTLGLANPGDMLYVIGNLTD
jgi:predicted deacylase